MSWNTKKVYFEVYILFLLTDCRHKLFLIPKFFRKTWLFVLIFVLNYILYFSYINSSETSWYLIIFHTKDFATKLGAKNSFLKNQKKVSEIWRGGVWQFRPNSKIWLFFSLDGFPKLNLSDIWNNLLTCVRCQSCKE